MQYGRVREDESLIVNYGAEFAPNDTRAALLYAFDQLGQLRDTRLLELGGGAGWHAAMLVWRGAHVVTTDVSPVGLEVARRRFRANGMDDRTEVLETPAETLPFPDASFDRVFGVAVLHHVEMDLAGPEIRRVLKPGGRAVFLEPLSENPVLDFVRDYVPYPGKKSPKGHRGMTFPIIEEASRHFERTTVKHFYLTSMLNRAFGHDVSITPLESLDSVLLRAFPALRRFSRHVVLTFDKQDDMLQ
jgi:ubiquinone/menaquinone biosynthesis C-methylase UbiE